MTDRPRLLYIDDDAGLRRLVARALDRRGFDIVAAEGGAEGVLRAAGETFDLIAVDHFMPDLDGLETLERLKALPAPPPVLYVTGSEDSRIAVAALKAGAVDYVVKTIGEDFFDLLANAAWQALDQVNLRRVAADAEEQLRASNLRLEALLREVNHRVANSLQIVSAFVQMQSTALDEGSPAREALGDTQRRIQAIAQVHRRLYTSSDVDAVAMDDYLAALVDELRDTWTVPGSTRVFRCSAAPIRLHTDKAVSLGVIVNELVSNACKYAYERDQAGEIRIDLSGDGPDHFRLTVEDDGCGLPANGTPRGTGLGSKLIRAMAASLQSTVQYDAGHNGCRAVLRAAY